MGHCNGFPNTYQLNRIVTSLFSFWTNGGQEWESEISFAFCTASFKGYNYSRTTWSGRMFSVRDLTQLKCGYWKNTNFLEGMPRATQTHVTRKECKVRRVTLLLDAPVSRYRRPLKIRDFVWEIKYWDLRTLNNVKSNFSFYEMNKKDLPAMYSIVFQCLTIARVASLAEVLARDAVRKKTCIRCEMTEARVRDQDPAPSLPDPVPKTTGVGTPLSLRDRDILNVLSS